MAEKEYSRVSKAQLWASVALPGGASAAQLCGFGIPHWRESVFKAEILVPELLVLYALTQEFLYLSLVNVLITVK